MPACTVCVALCVCTDGRPLGIVFVHTRFTRTQIHRLLVPDAHTHTHTHTHCDHDVRGVCAACNSVTESDCSIARVLRIANGVRVVWHCVRVPCDTVCVCDVCVT